MPNNIVNAVLNLSVPAALAAEGARAVTNGLLLAASGLLRQQASFALFQRDDLVGFQIIEGFFSSARPEDFDTLDFRRGADSEMQAHIILGDIAVAAAHFVHLLQPGGRHGAAGADAVAVRFAPDRLDQDPVLLGAIVLQSARRIVHIVDADLKAAVIVEVAEGRSS